MLNKVQMAEQHDKPNGSFVVKPFKFEETVHVTPSVFKTTWRTGCSSLFVPGGVVVSIGIACLFWIYTMSLGIAILALCLLSIPLFIIAGRASFSYRKYSYLHSPVTFGASEKGLWARGDGFEARCEWKFLDVWDESNGWLVLSPNALPQLYFQVSSLKKARVYDCMMELASASASKYGDA